MTVTGFSRLTDLIGIINRSVEYKEYDYIIQYLDEMQGIINKLPDDEDSKYVLNELFQGTKLNQALAQLEVHKEESIFVAMLEFALGNPKIKEKIKEMLE